ncbi:MAG: mandelate racemase/muconate lactonizing enzyme family protein [Anaerolineae bacterium]|nr:mandelate racemase/muconate lactonizing enzyme family protein [Anaerolineae bacterium]
MKITGVRCLLLSAPYATPDDIERTRHLKSGLRPASLIKVETDAGLYGLGETYAGVYAPETVRELVNQFAYDLVGQEAEHPTALAGRLRQSSYYWGRMGISQSVIGGIEMALWDLRGKALGVPVCDLLGGRVHEPLPVYASGGNNKPADQLREELRGYLAAGYRAIKIRINNLPHLDAIVEKIAICREAGTDFDLMVDAVQGLEKRPWTTKFVLELARQIEPYQIRWLEEPAEVTDYAGFAEIRRRTHIPIAGGETVTSMVEAEQYLSARALDVFQPDAAMIGGLSIFRQAAQMAERQWVQVAVHVWCGGVGILGNYHAAFATPNCTILELPSVPNPLREAVMIEPLVIENGSIRAPRLPGLGVYLPDDLVERFPYRPGSVYRVLGN